MTGLRDSIQYLKGVGAVKAKAFKKLGILTPLDLLYHFPRDYVDYTNPVSIINADQQENNVIKAILTKKMREARIRSGLTIYKAIFFDGESDFTVIIYNNHFQFDALKENEEYYLYGKVSGGFTRREMSSPQIIKADTENLIIPVYHLTEGLSNQFIVSCEKQALKLLDDNGGEYLPKSITEQNNLCSLGYAFHSIHLPESRLSIDISRKRFCFDELFILQLGLLNLKGRNRKLSGCRMYEKPVDDFYRGLPFTPTGAQMKAIAQIEQDMTNDTPMNRLLQGDVGSGKTLVAAAACYFAFKNGYQSALMAPTEILATQHYSTLSDFLNPLGVKVCVLTGSLSMKDKKALKQKISAGEYNVIVGTHALVQQSTEFNRLGLVITDEQHRFGVNQRTTLAEKGDNPHKLVMSATPIPRTLGLIIYGDLDISVLDEMPKGRKPIETYAVTDKLRQRSYNFIKKQLEEGHQGYIVCPMIEESDSDLLAVKSYYEKLKNGFFADYNLGLLHGKMSASEKDTVMADFKAGKINLLISTTVIEVGVDVPNANIMVIENSERFGLSQLHQLRGRVGRGTVQSYCILITSNPTEETKKRLQIMSDTNDGFRISEEDMKIRGCGDFFGERQHGLPPLKIASFDSELLSVTQNLAKELIKQDPDLEEYPLIRQKIRELFGSHTENGYD